MTVLESEETMVVELRHDAMTGTHAHPHPAMDSQGGDETHDHEHSHAGDANHDHHSRSARTHETRAKYSQAEIDAMGKKGQAFGPDTDGHYSYPIGDEEDLSNAIHAVGRGNADHDAIRKYIAGRAKALGKSSMIPDNWAADGSLRADTTDLERRKALAASLSRGGGALLPGGLERRSANTGPIEARSADDGKLHISGYASVFDRPYDMGMYAETVKRGAFTKTLSENPQVHLLLNHSGLPLASTLNGSLQLREDSVGLHFDAALDPDDPDSQAAYRKVKTGLMQECSFAFRAIRQAWSDDYSERSLTEVSIDKGDTSICNFGASPHTSVNARSLDGFERQTVQYVLDIIESEGRSANIDQVKHLLSGIVGEERADTKQCPTCDGDGTIRDGNVECPTCDGSGEVAADYEEESAASLPELRAAFCEMVRAGIRKYVSAMLEPRVGATLSAATKTGLQSVLDKANNADTNLDELLIELSAILGVTNPDIAQDAALDREPDEPEQKQSPSLFPQFFQHNSAAEHARFEALRYPPGVSA